MKTQSRSNTVIVPSAHTPKLCVVEEGLAAGESVRDIVTRTVKQYSRLEGFVIDLLLTNGCRIGEAIGVKPGDILSDNSVLIHGEKGGSDRVCFLSVISGMKELQEFGLRLMNPGYNRWYFYRIFKKLGIYGRLVKGRRNAVCHFGRHRLISGLARSGVDTATIQKALGHRSIRSTAYYLDNEVE